MFLQGHSSGISVNEPQINQQAYNDETTLFGVQERIVAIQSLFVLIDV